MPDTFENLENLANNLDEYVPDSANDGLHHYGITTINDKRAGRRVYTKEMIMVDLNQGGTTAALLNAIHLYRSNPSVQIGRHIARALLDPFIQSGLHGTKKSIKMIQSDLRYLIRNDRFESPHIFDSLVAKIFGKHRTIWIFQKEESDHQLLKNANAKLLKDKLRKNLGSSICSRLGI